jgi:pyrroline-5-carboxylate reductase
VRLGFIGTGAITKAVVTGLVHSGLELEQISLSPRNADTAARLAELDDRIQVGAGNQDVLDACDTVCVAVLPQIAAEVLHDLQFEQRHHVISFLPGRTIAELRHLAHPATGIARAIPLPAVASGHGCTAICPPDALTRSVFSALGDVVEVDSEDQFDALQAVTATMASFYAVLEQQASWLTQQGLPYRSARAFVSAYTVGLAQESALSDRSFPEMIDDHMTPGGLNEQVHAELSSVGAYDHYAPALDRVLARLQRPV